ncbi:hypothetical protein NN561_020091 [Cricetulus griseus]
MKMRRVAYAGHRPCTLGRQGDGGHRRAFTREDVVRRRGAWSAGTNLLVQQTRGNYDVDSRGPPVEEGRDGQLRRMESREHKKRKLRRFGGAVFF